MTQEGHSGDHGDMPPEVRLGNDIARQFAHLPESDAVDRIAAHLQRFWDPRMRRRLRDRIALDDDGLDPLLVAAARGL